MKMPSPPPTERRSAERTSDDADWESKVLARVSGRLQERACDSAAHSEPALGWEATVLDVLRRRIEKESK
jgi:hypothetical protein